MIQSGTLMLIVDAARIILRISISLLPPQGTFNMPFVAPYKEELAPVLNHVYSRTLVTLVTLLNYHVQGQPNHRWKLNKHGGHQNSSH